MSLAVLVSMPKVVKVEFLEKLIVIVRADIKHHMPILFVGVDDVHAKERTSLVPRGHLPSRLLLDEVKERRPVMVELET